ncbi:MAG: SDR family NAD(P)-dependent oxidoreductase [Bacteroidales bacterium]
MKALITGGTNGMGKGVAIALAGTGKGDNEIILLCRSKELGEATIKEIESLTGNKKTTLVICDLARLRDVRSAISEIKSRHDSLDCIFVNAGLGYARERVETEDRMDPHFQVNYLSHFMLILNMLSLLEKSDKGGRVIFNVTRGGEIFWDDIQMNKKWGFEDGVHQAMTAKRMMIVKLHDLYSAANAPKVSFTGFEIPKTVWSNQLTIIPAGMKMMATIMRFFGTFISIEKCGEIMAPLFTESREESLGRSGKFVTSKNNRFTGMNEKEMLFKPGYVDKLWKISLDLCNDAATYQVSENLHWR